MCFFIFYFQSKLHVINLYSTGRIFVVFGQVTQYLQDVMRLPYGPTHQGNEIKWNRPTIYTHFVAGSRLQIVADKWEKALFCRPTYYYIAVLFRQRAQKIKHVQYGLLVPLGFILSPSWSLQKLYLNIKGTQHYSLTHTEKHCFLLSTCMFIVFLKITELCQLNWNICHQYLRFLIIIIT